MSLNHGCIRQPNKSLRLKIWQNQHPFGKNKHRVSASIIFSKPRPLLQADTNKPFDCGMPSLNSWLQRHAWENQKSGVSRTNVMFEIDASKRDEKYLAAFVSLANAEIRRECLPKPQQRNKPQTIPTVLLGQLAVDEKYQKQGVAKSLLFFAYKTAVQVAEKTGCYCLLTHPLDDNASAFYRHWGFVETPFDPDGSMLIRIADLKKSGF